MFGMIEMISGGAIMLLAPLILVGTAVPVLIYLVARWRNYRDNADNPDTQIGVKVAIHALRVVSFQLLLLAGFLFLLAVISEIPTAETIRFAIGLGLPAGGVFFVHRMLAGKTNGATYPAVQRMFDGWNALITAIPGFVALIAFFVVTVADIPAGKADILRMIVPYLLVYTGAWVGLSFLWFKGAGLLPQPVSMGTAPQQQQQHYQQHGGGYPPQGGGGYPPQGGGGYPPQGGSGGYPPQGGGGYPPQGGGGYPPQGGGGYPPQGGGGGYGHGQ